MEQEHIAREDEFSERTEENPRGDSRLKNKVSFTGCPHFEQVINIDHSSFVLLSSKSK